MLPHEHDSLHEVYLEGSANQDSDPTTLARLLNIAFEALRPGAEIRIHGLFADRSLAGPWRLLPGPAAAVQHVPFHADLTSALTDSGFVDAVFEKLSATAHFVVEGVPLREFVVAARKPSHRPTERTHTAIYLGPLSQVTDDFRNRYLRGTPTPLNIHDWLALERNASRGRFLLVAPGQHERRRGPENEAPE